MVTGFTLHSNELCNDYTTTGWPYFKPKCKKGHWASLKCHSVNKGCKDYQPFSLPNGLELRLPSSTSLS